MNPEWSCRSERRVYGVLQEIDEKQLRSILAAASTEVSLFIHTPLCGTCKVARRMLEIALQTLPHKTVVYVCDLNLMPRLAEEWQIESVPCLLRWSHGKVIRKTYAFQSVDHVWNWLRSTSDVE
jgi:thioredoxin 1